MHLHHYLQNAPSGSGAGDGHHMSTNQQAKKGWKVIRLLQGLWLVTILERCYHGLMSPLLLSMLHLLSVLLFQNCTTRASCHSSWKFILSKV